MDDYKSSDNNKLYFLSNITENFGHQTYLELDLPQSKTKHITKLRISSHHLQFEWGRYTKRENRLCNNCNIVEDGVHFLFLCTKNELARRQISHWSMFTSDCRWQRGFAVRYNVGFLKKKKWLRPLKLAEMFRIFIFVDVNTKQESMPPSTRGIKIILF